MPQVEEQTFDDPALKATIRRACAGECASARLRRRVQLCLAGDHSSAGPLPTGGMRINATLIDPVSFSTLLPGFAMAASMLLAVGLVAVVLSSSSQAMPQALQSAAILRHDSCCLAPEHQDPRVPIASFATIGAYLRQELNHPVLAADMTKDHWNFSGVAICPLAGAPSAHLLFRDGDKSLSLFSLPASVVPSMNPNQIYEGATSDGHTLVARSQDGAVYCLVCRAADGPITVDALDQMLEKHRGEATVAAIDGPRITLAGVGREP